VYDKCGSNAEPLNIGTQKELFENFFMIFGEKVRRIVVAFQDQHIVVFRCFSIAFGCQNIVVT
jgi:hypothetical protein